MIFSTFHIMENSNINIYGIGQCAWDFLGKIDTFPPANSKCEFTDLVVQGGGPIATALVALQRWGYICAFSGVTGDDEYGHQIIHSISSEGVDITGVKIRKNAGSQVAFSMAEPETGNRTIFWRRPTGSDLSPDEIETTLFKKIKLLHTDGIFSHASLSAASLARKHKVPVSVDAGSLRPGMLELAQISNFFIASETFAKQYAPENSPDDTCRKLAELGPEVVAVTVGERGYVAIADGNLIKGKAYKSDTIDTTGCGDLFHAGFIYGILQKWPVRQCLDFGAWAAAMVSRSLGGRDSIPDHSAIKQYKIEHKIT